MSLIETSCCGLSEVEGLSTNPKETLLEICHSKYDEWGPGKSQAFILFTDAVKYKRGTMLAKYIEKNKLGVIYKTTRAKKNPNTNNLIIVWIWSPNEKNLRSWWKKNRDESDYDDDNY